MPVTVIKPGPGEGMASYIEQLNPSKNNSSETRIEVGNPSTTSAALRGFILIPLSGIPSGASVLSAELRLYREGGPNTSWTIAARRVNGPWDEATLNWSNAPASSTGVTSTVTAGSGYRVWNVTAIVQAWIDGTNPNYGFELRANSDTSQVIGAHRFTIQRGVESQRPELVVTWDPPPYEPPPPGNRGYNAPIIGRRGRGVLTF